MDKPHLLNVITILRRATRNHDVMTVCDALESLLVSDTRQPSKRTSDAPSFNKQLWQKQYMKEYRQGKRRRTK